MIWFEVDILSMYVFIEKTIYEQIKNIANYSLNPKMFLEKKIKWFFLQLAEIKKMFWSTETYKIIKKIKGSNSPRIIYYRICFREHQMLTFMKLPKRASNL